MKVVALAGGVGGAKLADGLAEVLSAKELSVVVNTGDDFEHLGLTICPDLDTVIYTLAELANPETGWGRADESWSFLQTLDVLGQPTWFRLGDRDLALHVTRTQLLGRGWPLSRVTREIRRRLGVEVEVLPMSDQPVRTMVQTTEGELPFQEYFVARGCEPEVTGFRFAGAERSSPAPEVLKRLGEADLVVLCPSNPWVSLDPILAVPEMRVAVGSKPVVGVSPIVGGRAIKGPAAKMFRELGIEPSALAVAQHYRDLLAGFMIDEADVELAPRIESMGIATHVTDTLMVNPSKRKALAEQLLAFSQGVEVHL